MGTLDSLNKNVFNIFLNESKVKADVMIEGSLLYILGIITEKLRSPNFELEYGTMSFNV